MGLKKQYTEVPQPLSSLLCIIIYTHTKVVKIFDLLVGLPRKLGSVQG